MAEKETIEDFDLVASEGFELVHIDEGVYDAELTKLVKVPDLEVVRNNISQKLDLLRWTFTTADGIEINGTSSAKFSPQAKAFQWAQKLLQKEISVGTTFKPKDLQGLPRQTIVKDKTRKREFKG
ncbi:MAG: hypothetical protein O8C67_09405 [Candidatus Methanoperedens sp.]|nr:hypothetical protein [Candidatus Methanoperedens sp.]